MDRGGTILWKTTVARSCLGVEGGVYVDDVRAKSCATEYRAARLRSPNSLEAALLLDGPLGKGLRLESLVGDREPALGRPAVRSPRDPLLGPGDGGKLLVELGREGDVDRLRIECRPGVLVLPGLLALKGSSGTDLAAELREHRFDARPRLAHEFTRPSLVQDHLSSGWSCGPSTGAAAESSGGGISRRLISAAVRAPLMDAPLAH